MPSCQFCHLEMFEELKEKAKLLYGELEGYVHSNLTIKTCLRQIYLFKNSKKGG